MTLSSRLRSFAFAGALLALVTGCVASNVPNVSITTTTLPNGVVGRQYSQQLQGSHVGGGWFIVDGALPNGLTLNTSGLISGTPTTADTFTFTVEADQNNSFGSPSVDQILTIVITSS